MPDKVKEQILVIRETGLTNMFDVNAVIQIAEALDFADLDEWLPGHRKEYTNFILTGEC